jgi:multidrug transporter EmrE-like cation transporter
MSFYVFWWLFASIVFETCGDVFTKRASGTGGKILWFGAALAYNLMLVAWFLAVARAKNIVIPGMVWLLAGEVALLFVGVGMFGEVLSVYQRAGCGLAAIAMVLLCVNPGV